VLLQGRCILYFKRKAVIMEQKTENESHCSQDKAGLNQLTPNQKTDLAHLVHPFSKMTKLSCSGPVIIERGEGCYVYDESGKKYLEAMSGLWCTSLGFSQKRLVEAARAQLEQLPFYHCFGARSHRPAIELAQRLAAIAPGDLQHLLFASSGSEANDTAVKLAWYYQQAQGRPKKRKIIARKMSYHGVTVLSGSLTGQKRVHEGFNLPIEGVLHAGFASHYYEGLNGETIEDFSARLLNELAEFLDSEDPDTVAAFIAEPVVTGAGVILPPPGYLKGLEALLREREVLFIADEVVTGFGRTGKMFASDLYNIRPDMMTLAKGLTSAYQPLSAVLMSQQVYKTVWEYSEKLGGFFHGTTYSAHPVAAAVALEVLDIYEQLSIIDRVQRLAPIFLAGLEKLAQHPVVGEVRGVGLLGGVEIAADRTNRKPFPSELAVPAWIQECALKKGLIVRAVFNSLALCPPLIIEEHELQIIFEKLKLCLDEALEHFSGYFKSGSQLAKPLTSLSPKGSAAAVPEAD
jgi:4-aminobutyrate--pyruvate transaminase